MKKLIRKWLGITDPPSNIERIMEVRQLIGEQVGYLLSGAPDTAAKDCLDAEMRARFSDAYKSRAIKLIEQAARESALMVAQAAVQEKVGNEAFIDSVVERIQKKQLP